MLSHMETPFRVELGCAVGANRWAKRRLGGAWRLEEVAQVGGPGGWTASRGGRSGTGLFARGRVRLRSTGCGVGCAVRAEETREEW